MIRRHIHHAADPMLDGIHYLNCGDWIESAKTSVETHSGKLKVVLWGIGTASRGAASANDFTHSCGGLKENPGRHKRLVAQVCDLAGCRRHFCSDAPPLD